MEFEIPENARKFVRHAKFRQDPINLIISWIQRAGKFKFFLKNARILNGPILKGILLGLSQLSG